MRRSVWRTVLIYAFVAFWSFVVLFPFYWLVTTSFKTPLAVSRGPTYIPFVDFDPTTRPLGVPVHEPAQHHAAPLLQQPDRRLGQHRSWPW
jgi:ABC-type glycerol-3-phosphate transport system permease component